MPYLSVIMAVYNGAAHLAQAVASVLNQTYADFEFIIVDDGSTDATPKILADFAARDARIRIVNNEPNIGLTTSLNHAWDLAQGHVIARMDADDICLPDRFSRQIAFLDHHPAAALCGTWVQTINEHGETGTIWQYPTAPTEIQFALLFGNVIAHPSVMLRKAQFEKATLRYNPAFQRAQDYELWLRAADVLALANLPQALLQYRVSSSQISQQHRAAQAAASAQSYTRRLQQLGLAPTPDELALHHRLFTGAVPCDDALLRQLGAWLAKIEQANRQSQVYAVAEFELFLAKKWLHLCRKCARMGMNAWHIFCSSPLHHHVSNTQQFKFFARCMLGHHPTP